MMFDVRETPSRSPRGEKDEGWGMKYNDNDNANLQNHSSEVIQKLFYILKWNFLRLRRYHIGSHLSTAYGI